MSTSFPAGARAAGNLPDAIIQSSDNILFHVHSPTILPFTSNAFHGLWLLQRPSRDGMHIQVSQHSVILDHLLFILYNRTIEDSQSPLTLDIISQILSALRLYGFAVDQNVNPDTPFGRLILSRSATYEPVEVYALVAGHNLEGLAVEISSQLHDYNIIELTDELAERMGPSYLRRLSLLLTGRVTALKTLLRTTPPLHISTVDCPGSPKDEAVYAWDLTIADLGWNAKPDTSPSDIELRLLALSEGLPCSLCKAGMDFTARHISRTWAIVKATI